MNDATDDLCDLLASRPGQEGITFRDSVLQQTESHLARRRWLRRGTRAAGVAAVFAAGGLLGWQIHPAIPATVAPIAPIIVGVPVPVPVPAPPILSQSSDRPLVTSNPSGGPETPVAAGPRDGSEFELQAEQADGPAAAALYKSAGDAFLRLEDYANATRCYRLFLIRGGDASLSLVADDSWLLTSLKNAAFLEKFRVQKTD